VILWITLLLTVVLFPQLGFGEEKTTISQELVWIRYFNKVLLSPEWEIFTEVENRRYIFPDRQHQWFAPHVRVQKKLGDDWKTALGFLAVFQSLPHDPKIQTNLVRPELRPHLDFIGKQPLFPFTLSHRYRLEARFFRKTNGKKLANGYKMNYRVRYRAQLAWPIRNMKNGAGAIELKISEEIMLNFGGDIVRNTFDQNRISTCVNYAFSPNFRLEMSLIHWYQQRQDGVSFYSRKILRLTLFHILKFY